MEAIQQLGSMTAFVFILGVIAVIGLIAFITVRRWIKVAGPDEALVISGSNKKKFMSSPSGTQLTRVNSKGEEESIQVPPESSSLRIVVNGRAMVNPLLERAEIMSLKARQMNMTVSAQSEDKISIEVQAVAMMKVGSHEDYVRRAAERFASQEDAIESFITNQLEGSLRGTIAQMTVSDLMRDRKMVSSDIAENIANDLSAQGLVLDSFQIKNINDNDGYIESLGLPEIEAKRQAASIAKINAEREVKKNELLTQEQTLKEQSTYEINVAASEAKIGQEQARADQARELAKAEAEQKVLDQRAKNREAELDAEVRRKADAEKYASETKAAAELTRAQRQAEAEAYERTRRAQADREVAENEAQAIEMKARAEANAIELAGKAKAEAIRAEAEALKENQNAILAQKMIEILPDVTEKWGASFSKIGGVNIIGGSDASATGYVAGENAMGLASVFKMMEDIVGIDLKGIINSHAYGNSVANAMKDSNDSSDKNAVVQAVNNFKENHSEKKNNTENDDM